jgi:hypothetical protein
MVKIGFTEREVEQRAADLSNSTNVPTPFIIEAYFCSKNFRVDEQLVHEKLHDYRLNKGREFFNLSIEKSTDLIQNILGMEPFYIGDYLVKLREQKERERLEQERLEKEVLENERLEKEAQENERLEQKRLEKEQIGMVISVDESHNRFCPNCKRLISSPSSSSMSDYALYWRDKKCPKCHSKLV